MKLEELSKEEHCSILQFPKAPQCDKPTTVTLMLPAHTPVVRIGLVPDPHQLGCYVMRVLDPKTGEVKKTYTVYNNPDKHLGGVYD